MVPGPDRRHRDQPGTLRRRQPVGEAAGHLPRHRPAGPARSAVDYPGDGTDVYYSEGTLVGYRWFDAQGQEPLFPFGYGLSYTTFRFSGLKVRPSTETPSALR